MGNLCSVKGAIEHWIYVKTGDKKGGGLDGNIKLVLYDSKQQKSPEISLDCVFKDFERGQTDAYQAPPLGGLGEIIMMELWRDDQTLVPDWYCETVMVNDTKADKCYYFPVQRWVRPSFHYMIPANATSLPSDDPYKEQRQMELEEKCMNYKYEQRVPDAPMQIAMLPQDEVFSDTEKYNLDQRKSDMITRSGLTRLTVGYWEDIKDLTNVYNYTDAFPIPKCIHHWSNDAWFGAQRIVGCNPKMIKLCTELPENMGVTAEMLRPFLEGWTVKQIIDAKRLFIVDYKILDDLPTKDDRPFVAPIGLFFLNGDKHLIPIAIQLQQDIAPDNPVFLCNDSPFTWIMAKMWFNLADAMVHQALSHLGFTHLLMNGICVATHRHLALNHPIYKLLAPHMVFLLSIDIYGTDYLLAPDSWVDRNTQIGREGMLELMRRGIEYWRIDVHGNFPKEMERRGVLDPHVLPNYAYRDHGLMVFKAIENYVGKIVKGYYDTSEKLRDDIEIQNWGVIIARAKEQGGIGIQGMPNRGVFKTHTDLISVLSAIIFHLTAEHAAISYGQYDEYGFPPNFPAYLNGDPPIDKTPRPEEDIVAMLPSKAITLDTMIIMSILSERAEKNLGKNEFQFQYDSIALNAEKQFKEELLNISRTIKERNELKIDLYKYTHLDPENIGNSVTI